MKQRILALFVRLVLPAGILAAGWYGFARFSIPVEEEIVEATEPKKIRTRVQPLKPCNYQVRIKSNGIVGPHNQVMLSAEVTGRIVKIGRQFEVGRYFSKGDVLLEIDDRDYKTALRIAQQEVRRSKSALELADAAHRRMERLVRRNSASESEFDTTFAARLQARNDVELAAANLDQAQRNLERTKVLAPFDGRVVSEAIGLGQLISIGTVLGEVFAVDFAEVRLPIATRDLDHLRLPEHEDDPPVDVTLRDAINTNNDAQWTGQIVRTEGALDPNSLELFAIARIPDPFALQRSGDVLRIGQPVTATIVGEMLENVIAIPRSYVRRMEQVHLVDPDSLTLRTCEVDPIWSDEDYVLTRGAGIRSGDYVATTMLVYAPEGAEVEIIPTIETDALAGQPDEGNPTP